MNKYHIKVTERALKDRKYKSYHKLLRSKLKEFYKIEKYEESQKNISY